jgi:hypothetical protein
MANQVFIDTSAFKALLDENDDFNKKADIKIKELIAQGCELVTSNYVVDETATLIRIRCGLKKALLFKEYLTESEPMINIYRITIKDEMEAWKWFDKNWSGLSYTDCVSFAMMKRLGITKYFGFDNHFDRAGYERV